MGLAWTYLLFAGICEIGWPLGFKLAQTNPEHKILWIFIAIVSIAVSGILLFLAQKTIPIGTAYAVWTGIGATGAFVVGVLLFKDPASILRIISVLLIICGVIGLKLTVQAN